MQMILILLTFFIWSTSFSLAKMTLHYSPPLFLTGFRMLFGGLLILVFLFFLRKKDLRIRKQQLFPLILFALAGIYLSNAFRYWGQQYLTAAKACLIYSLSPFLAAVFSYFQFKERLTRKKIIGLLIGFIGFIPVFLKQSGAEELLGGSISFFSWAEISLILATLTAAYGWVLLRKLGKDDGMSPLMANGSAMVLGGFFALIHSAMTEQWSPTPVSSYLGFVPGVLMIILVSNLICYNMYGWLLKRFTATFLSVTALTIPLFASFFGWLILGETVTWPFFLSLGVISVGLWFVYSEELRLGYIVKKAQPQVE